MNDNVTVVVMAAGLGTRMRSRQAKVLHRAGGRTLIEHVLAASASVAPPERTFVVIGHQADRVRELLRESGVGFIHQPEQKGTGHAVLCGREQLAKLGGSLVVLNGDGPLLRSSTIEELVRRSRASGAAAVMMTAELDDPTGYGRIVRDAHGHVEEIAEQKAGTPEQLAIREVNTGQYCFDADRFWAHIDELRDDNAAHEYYLTDMIGILIRAGYKVEPYPVADSSELMGINNRVELAGVDAIFRSRKVHELMLAGTTIERPETVTVDGAVTAGMDTVIEPFVRLLGKTRIGENCRIGRVLRTDGCRNRRRRGGEPVHQRAGSAGSGGRPHRAVFPHPTGQRGGSRRAHWKFRGTEEGCRRRRRQGDAPGVSGRLFGG